MDFLKGRKEIETINQEKLNSLLSEAPHFKKRVSSDLVTSLLFINVLSVLGEEHRSNEIGAVLVCFHIRML